MTDFTTPRTWNVDEYVTKLMLDTHVRDNFKAVWAGTTAGDMDYYTSAVAKARLALVQGGVLYGGASAPAYLPIGASNTFLKSNGSAPTWGSLLVNRQGSSSTIWSLPGSTTYTPTGVVMQAGIQNIVVTSGGTNYVTITYPTAFTQRPLILLGANMSGGLATTWSVGWTDDTANGFNLHLKFTSTSQTGTQAVAWLAIGA